MALCGAGAREQCYSVLSTLGIFDQILKLKN